MVDPFTEVRFMESLIFTGVNNLLNVKLPYIISVCCFIFYKMFKSPALSAFIPKQAIFRMIPKDEICKLPSDENTADKRVEKLWRFFKKSEKGEKFIIL